MCLYPLITSMFIYYILIIIFCRKMCFHNILVSSKINNAISSYDTGSDNRRREREYIWPHDSTRRHSHYHAS